MIAEDICFLIIGCDCNIVTMWIRCNQIPRCKRKLLWFYTKRLIACKLPTLHFRRIRENMIETYKILSGKYDRSATPTLPVAGPAVTIGHNLRLYINLELDMIYVNITLLVEYWIYGILPSYVISAENVNCFKSRLDNFMEKSGYYLWLSVRYSWNRKPKWSSS